MTEPIAGLTTQLGLVDVDVGADVAGTSSSGPMVDLAKRTQLWDDAVPEISALFISVYRKTMTVQDAKAEYRKISDRIKQQLLQTEVASGSSQVGV